MAKPPEAFTKKQVEVKPDSHHVQIADLLDKLFEETEHFILEDGAHCVWVYSKNHPEIEHLTDDDVDIIERIIVQRYSPLNWRDINVTRFTKTFRQSVDYLAIAMMPVSTD